MNKYILKLFIALQFIFILSWFFGKVIFLPRKDFLGKHLVEIETKPLLWSRANFDGFHYVQIARDGYQYLQQAFFPFYPRLIKLFQPFFGSFIFSGIFVSSLFFILTLWIFAKLLKQEGEDEKTIKKTLLFLILFPTSFYFISVYTESIFLFLILLSFYLAAKQKWLWAGLVAGLASYTRLVGIFMFFALLHECYEQKSCRKMKDRVEAAKKALGHKFSLERVKHFLVTRKELFKNLFFISLSSWGLLIYMFFLKVSVGDPYYFIRVQPDFGAQRTSGKLILFYQVVWRYLKMVFTVSPWTPTYFIIWLEIFTTGLFLFLLVWAWFRLKIRKSWLVFSTLAFLLPSLTGTFSSMPRYVLVCFPAFLVLAKLKLPKTVYILSFLLLLTCSALFSWGYWIA